MKIIAMTAIAAVFVSGCSLRASTECTSAPESEWQDQNVFQQNLLAQGYQIDKFVVTDGSCYEIYGTNQAGQEVEIYFDPVSGDVVKEEIE